MSCNFSKGILIAFSFTLFINRKLKTLISIYSLYKSHLTNSKTSLVNNSLIFYFCTTLKNIPSIIMIFYF